MLFKFISVVLESSSLLIFSRIFNFHSKTTNAADTILIANEFVKIVNIILFVGGDGTARDIYSVTSDKIPLIGIPPYVVSSSS